MRCIASPNCTPFAGASPATACGGRWPLLQREIPLADPRNVPTGTPVFDWTVPKEWNIRDAWIKSSRWAARLSTFARSNLHVLNYSVAGPHASMSLRSSRRHLITLPRTPRLDSLPDFLLPGKLGASAWPTTRLGGAGGRSVTRCGSIRRSPTGYLTLWRMLFLPGGLPTRS